MKRSPQLAPLSRDHQHALAAALRLRRADPETAQAAVAYFLDFFEREGRRHFAVEERHLLAALPADDPDWAPAVARVRADHAAIRAEAAALAAGRSVDSVAAVTALGDRLKDHVRFEEEVMFTLLEQRLTPQELERLGEALA